MDVRHASRGRGRSGSAVLRNLGACYKPITVATVAVVFADVDKHLSCAAAQRRYVKASAGFNRLRRWFHRSAGMKINKWPSESITSDRDSVTPAVLTFERVINAIWVIRVGLPPADPILWTVYGHCLMVRRRFRDPGRCGGRTIKQ